MILLMVGVAVWVGVVCSAVEHLASADVDVEQVLIAEG